MIMTREETSMRLRELRLEAGFSQKAVAEALCCSRSTYSYLEMGVTDLKADVLQRLAAIYQLPFDAFFMAAGTKYTRENRSKRQKHDPAERVGDLSEEEKGLIAVLRVQEDAHPESGLIGRLTEQARGEERAE